MSNTQRDKTKLERDKNEPFMKADKKHTKQKAKMKLNNNLNWVN